MTDILPITAARWVRTYLLAAACLAGIVFPAAAQVSVSASVNENTIGTEDAVTFSIQVKGADFSNIEVPEPPQTEGLALVQPTPSTQQSISIINGRLEQSLSFRWQFRPLREGHASIGGARIRISGKDYTTDTIAISVVSQTQRPTRRPTRRPSLFSPPSSQSQPDQPEASIAETDLFIRAQPSARNVFRNQQVTVDYVLFFREGIQLRGSRLADSWDAEGFWREDLEVESRPIPRLEVINGLRYNRITLKRVALFPTRAGNLTMDPLSIEAEAFVPRRARDPFDQFFTPFSSRFQPVSISSPPVRVNTEPLPADAPASFNGAVGSFRLSARVDRQTVEIGDAVRLLVTVSGAGNIATLDAPRLQLPTLIESFDPEISETINRKGQRVQGTKTFAFVLIPQSGGRHTLPPVEMSYFDPNSRSYKTLRTNPIEIDVSGTASTAVATALTAAGLPANDIAGPMPGASDWYTVHATPVHTNLWYYLPLLVPLVLLLGLYQYRRYATRLATDAQYARSRRAHPAARKHLKKAEALLKADQPDLFYEEIDRAVLGFVGNRLNIAELAMTRSQLDQRLALESVPETTRNRLHLLREECDHARYAPVRPSHDAMETATERAAELIAELDELFSRQPAPAAT